MRQSVEQELDLLIDSLNQEQQPKQISNRETAELLAVVRAVKSLGKQAEPSLDLGSRVYSALGGRSRRRWALPSVAALVAGLLLLAAITTWTSFLNRDVVYAMEQAIARLNNYYGVLEVHSKNASGEEWPIQRVEIWSEGKKYATRQEDGTLTVNNGERRWQVRPKFQEVAVLPLVPDPTRHEFDLRDEAKRARQYPHSVVGQETIAGRQAIKLKISPPGGLPYYLWVDAQTNLPLQLQTAMQNSLQTTYTFVSFEPDTQIDPKIFSYQPPDGYKVVEKDPGQLVATPGEAATISKITPLLPLTSPSRIFAFQDRIVLDYGDTTIIETAVKGAFKPVTNSALGTAAGGPLEVWQERLRWRQNGIEIQVEGPRRVNLARQ
ncbi:MAG TPA: sigma-E factor regulatory protein RseB domain-containing protein, partial [Anaerolineae bacterium]|nr:sigma-E factor regulatory protein RseB domain-containing protein [Anaerolineae bacterium]